MFWRKDLNHFSKKIIHQPCSNSAQSKEINVATSCFLITAHKASWEVTRTNSSNNVELPAVMWHFRRSENVSNQWLDNQSYKWFLEFLFVPRLFSERCFVLYLEFWPEEAAKFEVWFWLILWKLFAFSLLFMLHTFTSIFHYLSLKLYSLLLF